MTGMTNGGFRLLVCSAVLAVTAGFVPAAHAAAPPAAASVPLRQAAAVPSVAARAAFLVDATADTVHYSRSSTRRMPVASLVKAMTAYVVLREAGPADVVKVTSADVRHAVAGGATTASLRAGERFLVGDLLYALMLPSGADAANALARRYGPGTSRFVAKMNGAARALGLRDTRYTNADGLPSPGGGGYSTARDQVRLAEIALTDPAFRELAEAGRHTVARTAVHRAYTWRSTNKLLAADDDVIGVKTGYTRAAGYCLLFASERDGRLLIGAVLGDSQSERRFRTAERLLDWAASAPPV